MPRLLTPIDNALAILRNCMDRILWEARDGRHLEVNPFSGNTSYLTLQHAQQYLLDRRTK